MVPPNISYRKNLSSADHRGFKDVKYINTWCVYVCIGRMPEPIDGISNLEEFKQILEENSGWVVLRFTAGWCKPCQRVKPHLESWFSRLPETVQVVNIDADDHFEIYAFMKNKKMISGIPALLAYRAGNVNYTFDESVSSSSPQDIDAFFNRVLAVPMPTPRPKT